MKSNEIPHKKSVWFSYPYVRGYYQFASFTHDLLW